jgi:hypothetical protein
MARTKKTVKKKQNHKVTDRFKATKGKIALALADLVKAEMQLRASLPAFRRLKASDRLKLWNWMCDDIESLDVVLDDYYGLLPEDSEEPEPLKAKPPSSLSDLPPLGSILGMAAGVFLTKVFSGPLPFGAPPLTAQPPQPPAKTDSIDVEYKRVEPERKRLKKGGEDD